MDFWNILSFPLHASCFAGTDTSLRLWVWVCEHLFNCLPIHPNHTKPDTIKIVPTCLRARSISIPWFQGAAGLARQSPALPRRLISIFWRRRVRKASAITRTPSYVSDDVYWGIRERAEGKDEKRKGIIIKQVRVSPVQAHIMSEVASLVVCVKFAVEIQWNPNLLFRENGNCSRPNLFFLYLDKNSTDGLKTSMWQWGYNLKQGDSPRLDRSTMQSLRFQQLKWRVNQTTIKTQKTNTKQKETQSSRAFVSLNLWLAVLWEVLWPLACLHPGTHYHINHPKWAGVNYKNPICEEPFEM